MQFQYEDDRLSKFKEQHKLINIITNRLVPVVFLQDSLKQGRGNNLLFVYFFDYTNAFKFQF